MSDEHIEIGEDQLGVAFVEVLYLPWQRQVRDQVLRGEKKFVVLACGARCGKDVLCANLSLEIAFRLALERRHQSQWFTKTPKVNVTVVAPRKELYGQSRMELDNKLPKELRRTDRLNINWVRLPGDIFWKFKTAWEADSQLVSDAPDIVIFSEASRTPPDSKAFRESLAPRLQSPGSYGLALLNGTPRCGRDHWYRQAYEDARQVRSGLALRLPSYFNPEMNRDDILERLKQQLGQELYDVEIEAKWPDESRALFSKSDFEFCLRDDLADCGGKTIIGIDPARSYDSTAVSVCTIDRNRGFIVREMHWLHGMPLQEQMVTISAIAVKYPRPKIVIDATGFGGQIYTDVAKDVFRRAEKVIDCTLSSGRKNHIIESLVAAMRRHDLLFDRMSIAQHSLDRLWAELAGFDYSITDRGEVAYSGEHDDMVLSLAMAYAYAQPDMVAARRRTSFSSDGRIRYEAPQNATVRSKLMQIAVR